jgi:hypothetical protein
MTDLAGKMGEQRRARRVVKKNRIILCGLALGGCLWAGSAGAPYQPPTYVSPIPNGGYMVTQSGAQPYQPPIYVNPIPNGGYIATQSGAQPYEPPTYIRPMPNGGAMITQPGRALMAWRPPTAAGTMAQTNNPPVRG